ncbi:hypothetical protein CIG75_14875 [Tumebacillus algifaecis]|uniref:DUF4871 domain-containing protein n=1 Tax=Tumebacillus algifaecis TaxID=1214604 RepID=A0A223D409_9BACL|nr:DUF4871 domain-containing protein [Tumebacillus algifaecis]ASS76114.1 hypothetical protein CIG75_14875 [Tumebacillus algifaecis]
MRKMVVALAFAVVLSGCFDEELGLKEPQATVTDNDAWMESPTFMVGDYRMRGIEGKVAFIDATFTAEGQKLMWHFWEEPEVVRGSFKVIGVQKETGEKVDVFAGPLGGELNGAVAHAPSLVKLPQKGVWRLDVFVGAEAEAYYGSIVVHV